MQLSLQRATDTLGRGGGGGLRQVCLEWNGGDGEGRAMPVLVHGLFVASLCLPALAAGGEAATAGPGLRRGTYCNEPALSPPPLLPLPLCPPPPRRRPVCAAGAVQPRGTRSVAASQCRDNHKSPLSGTSSGTPGRTSTALSMWSWQTNCVRVLPTSSTLRYGDTTLHGTTGIAAASPRGLEPTSPTMSDSLACAELAS